MIRWSGSTRTQVDQLKQGKSKNNTFYQHKPQKQTTNANAETEEFANPHIGIDDPYWPIPSDRRDAFRRVIFERAVYMFNRVFIIVQTSNGRKCQAVRARLSLSGCLMEIKIARRTEEYQYCSLNTSLSKTIMTLCGLWIRHVKDMAEFNGPR